MNLYGDLPPAQGEAVKGTVSAWKPPASVTPSTSSVPGNKSGVKPSLAFKPRQATQPLQNPKIVPVASLPTPLVGKSVAQHSATPSLTPGAAPACLPPVSANVSNVPSDMKGDNVTAVAQEFNHNSNFDVPDAYDPRVPNEYIAYCEERLEKRRVARVEEENRRVMAEAERARTDLEQERRAASSRGDYQSLLMLSQGGAEAQAGGQLGQPGGAMGRGRGRGLVNLPAWMTQQLAAPAEASVSAPLSSSGHSVDPVRYQDAPQSTEISAAGRGGAQAEVAVAVGVKRKQTSQFNKPSLVLLLKNMVGPDEVDEQLGPETQQECQRYGPVASCLVHALPPSVAGLRCPDEERVRTFVEFHSQESAVRAFRDMNGRFFGGRQIAASFYDEDRYRRRELAPDEAESAAWV